jgi:hypothetical protein
MHSKSFVDFNFTSQACSPTMSSLVFTILPRAQYRLCIKGDQSLSPPHFIFPIAMARRNNRIERPSKRQKLNEGLNMMPRNASVAVISQFVRSPICLEELGHRRTNFEEETGLKHSRHVEWLVEQP